MVRETSIDAYRNIKENGLLSLRRWQVYSTLFNYGPMTGGELFVKMQSAFRISASTNSNVTTRLGELRAMGVARELGIKECEVSGQSVTLWDVTGNLPVKIKKQIKHKCPNCNGLGYIAEFLKNE